MYFDAKLIEGLSIGISQRESGNFYQREEIIFKMSNTMNIFTVSGLKLTVNYMCQFINFIYN